MILELPERLSSARPIDVSPVAQVPAVEDLNATIDRAIHHLLDITMRRCCEQLRSLAKDFGDRRDVLNTNIDPFAYLNDPYLRSMAIAAEEHFSSGRRNKLATLFVQRDTALAQVAQN